MVQFYKRFWHSKEWNRLFEKEVALNLLRPGEPESSNIQLPDAIKSFTGFTEIIREAVRGIKGKV